MAKKKKGKFEWEDFVTCVIVASGLLAMVGATMAIFHIPYGIEIAQAGGLWFTVSFVIALLYVAAQEEAKKKKGKKGGN